LAPTLDITASIDGRDVPRAEVLAWEARRAAKVLRKLRANVDSDDVAELRRVHIARKLELGHEAIEALLARELRLAASSAGIGAALSRGRRRMCTIELTGRGATVEGIPAWYLEAITANDEVPLIEACPDHYISRTRGDGRQEIIETTGGSPFALRMFFDDGDVSALRSEPDRTFPVEWTSVARDDSGRAIGGVRHLFRDGPDGFQVCLTVEFPSTTLPHMVRQHRWHLACEFSNWIEAANAAEAAPRGSTPG
jgi:hypothetical protein